MERIVFGQDGAGRRQVTGNTDSVPIVSSALDPLPSRFDKLKGSEPVGGRGSPGTVCPTDPVI